MSRFLIALIFVFLSVGSLLSCSKEKSKLQINVVPDSINLIDGTWYKCGSVPSDADLSGLYFTASRIEFSWTGTNQLVIQQVKVALESGDLGQTEDVSLSGDELIAMFSTYESPAGSGAIVLTPGTADSTDCGLRVGGITLKDKNKSAFINATVKVKGIEIDAAGDSVGNVSGEQTITIEYEP